MKRVKDSYQSYPQWESFLSIAKAQGWQEQSIHSRFGSTRRNVREVQIPIGITHTVVLSHRRSLFNERLSLTYKDNHASETQSQTTTLVITERHSRILPNRFPGIVTARIRKESKSSGDQTAVEYPFDREGNLGTLTMYLNGKEEYRLKRPERTPYRQQRRDRYTRDLGMKGDNDQVFFAETAREVMSTITKKPLEQGTINLRDILQYSPDPTVGGESLGHMMGLLPEEKGKTTD